MDSKLIPEDWKIATLGEVAKCRNGAGIKQDFFSDSGVPLARISDFTSKSINLANCIKIDEGGFLITYEFGASFINSI